MAPILHFPKRFFGKSTESPAPESTLDHPRPGPHLVIAHPRPSASLALDKERFIVVSRIDLNLARRSNRSRLRRLFSPTDYPETWPLGAA